MNIASSVIGAAVAALLLPMPNADSIDWNTHCIDGVQLTGNYDVRYLNTNPRVKVTVEGKTQQQADGLVDGDAPGPTSVSWAAGRKVDITIDLTADRLVAGIVLLRGGRVSSWRMSTSLDGRRWREIPEERLVRVDEKVLMAANLALAARYVRIRAVPKKGGLNIREIYIFGEKKAAAPTVGGIYPSWFPPVAGQEITLRAVIRNVSNQVAAKVKVEFRQVGPGQRMLGEDLLDELPGGSARVASIRWRPGSAEPHEIVVTASGPGLERSQRRRIIPVVNRRLYFSNFHPIDNERLKYANMYTTVGGGFEYFLAKIRGRLGLYPGNGPHVTGNIGVQKFVTGWLEALKGPFRDGLAMDEWGTPYPEACQALAKLYKQKGDRLIVPWLAGGASQPYAKCLESADLVLAEVYFNYRGHHTYRAGLDQHINAARKWGLLDKWIIALGVFAPGKPSTPEEIEREVRYLRLRGPEMPGVAFYGYSRRPIVRQNDELCYKYFIAPVVVLNGRPRPQGDSLRVTVGNIGGMNAHDVKLAAVNQENNQELGSAVIELVRPGEQRTATIKTHGPPTKAACRILPGEAYTALNAPPPLEVYPDRQVKGLPVTLCWTPPRPGEQGRSADRLDFVNLATGKTDYRIDQPGKKGTWNNGNLYLDHVATDGLSAGEYAIRLVDSATGRIRAHDKLTVVSRAGKLYVSRLNGKPWTGDPQRITIDPGDTFDVTWDLRDCRLGNPAIYISAPGDEVRMPREDGSFAVVRPAVLGPRADSPTGEPGRFGSWRWKSRIDRDDLLLPFWDTAGGWIWYRGRLGPDFRRVNMAANPGKWRLWVGATWPAFPITPVITVNVRGRQAPPPTPLRPPVKARGQGKLDVTIDAPQQITTADMVIVTVTAVVKGDLVVGRNGRYVDRIELFKTDRAGGDIHKIPKLKLTTVRNPDKTAREFTARFMITSPQPGTPHYCIWTGYPEQFIPFSIKVVPKTVPVGQQDTVRLAMAVPDGVIDSENFIDRLELNGCHAKPTFGPYGRSGVWWLTNMPALLEARGKRVARKHNPNIMSPVFEAELPVGPEDQPGVKYYLVWYGYLGRTGRWALVSVYFRENAP